MLTEIIFAPQQSLNTLATVIVQAAVVIKD
jgi:hypothetical protein